MLPLLAYVAVAESTGTRPARLAWIDHTRLALTTEMSRTLVLVWHTTQLQARRMVHATTAGRITQEHVAAVAAECTDWIGQCGVIAVVGFTVGEAG